MKNRILLFIGFVILISSCKKKDEETDPHAGSLVTHYSYVKGIVIDSITGLPLPNAKVFCSSTPFTINDSYSPNADSTDINGAYIIRMEWRTGYGYSSGYQYKPSDSTNHYVNSYSSNLSNFNNFKWWQLLENDTLTLPNLATRPNGYIGTHIKDLAPSSFGINVYWNKLIGRTTINYSDYYPVDTTIYHGACLGVIGVISWGSNSQSVSVNSGDTTFVDVFY